ncbi:MAG: hypothetical protein R3F14_43480 [Polyangiaceae bacterium]
MLQRPRRSRSLLGLLPPPAPPPHPRPLAPPPPATAPLAALPQLCPPTCPRLDRGLWHRRPLSLPACPERARVPAVVIVHGSGPMSRDGVMRGQIGLGFGFELPVYKRLAEALTARGYAVYRYDKRTCGSFNDCLRPALQNLIRSSSANSPPPNTSVTL